MKGSILTTKTWFLLIGAALLISAGLLNFRQRVRHETPPGWCGVGRHQRRHLAKSIEKGSAADRAWMCGRPLIGISLDGKGGPNRLLPHATCRSISSTPASEASALPDERASYSSDVGAYWADLDNLGAIHKWTPRVLYINLIGLIFLFVGFFVLFKQGGRAPYALHFATFCLAAFVFLFYTPVGSYRDLDLAIVFLDNAALILFAPLFLHFCALYPSRQQLFATRRWRAVLLYVPACLLLGSP